MDQYDISDDRPVIDDDTQSPPDRLHVVYITFFIIGLANLIPWNFFITAKSYFLYKLRNTSIPNGSDPFDPEWITHDQLLFENYVAFCMMFPFTISNFINLSIQKRVSAFSRFFGGSVVMFIVFIITIAITQVEMDAKIFLGITLTSIIFMNVGCAFTQGSLMGVVSALPSNNIRALLEGQAFAGILAASANILVLSMTPNPKICGLAFFSIALGFIVLSIFLWISLSKNAYFNYYWNRKDLHPDSRDSLIDAVFSEETLADHDIEEAELERPLLTEDVDTVHLHSLASSSKGLMYVMREVFYPGLCAFLTFVTTLSLFPSVLALIQSMHYNSKDLWTATYFVPVTVFLSFNVCDYIGRGVGGLLKRPRVDQPCLLGCMVLLRFLFIPLVLFCNQQPRFHLPVLLAHDAFPILLVILIGLTNGHVLTIAIMYAPSFASSGNRESAGIAMGIYMALGLSSGVALSFALVYSI